MNKVEKKRIAITGLNGVIGGVMLKKIIRFGDIIDLYRSNRKNYKGIVGHHFIDLLDKSSINKSLYGAAPDIVIHLAAATHIDACQEDMKRGKEGFVWKTNVQATKEIARFCSKNRVPMIFLSTECVFDGKKEYFKENDKKRPINWYGFTKSAAEEEIFNEGGKFSIVRAVVTYYKESYGKTLYGNILKTVSNKLSYHAVNDQYFTPTYTYDIVRAVTRIIDYKLEGVLHVASPNRITPYDFGRLILKSRGLKDKLLIESGLREVYGRDGAKLRLKNATLDSSQSIKLLGFKPKSPYDII